MREGWRTERLGDLCNIELGRTPARADSTLWDVKRETRNVWLSIADLPNGKDGIVSESKEYISDKGAPNCKIVPKGTLLCSFKLSLGRLAFAGRDLYTNEAIAAITILNSRKLSNALTQTVDSQGAVNVRICVDGTDSMRVVERVGPQAA